VFYFKMTNNQSAGAQCFTLAIYALDEKTGKQMAEAQNGGFTAMAISYSEYVHGC
jgi:hypothetical protein